MTKFKTPLISELRKSGGTFYTMPSATEDVGLNINESTNKVAMSHYVLLNIPITDKDLSNKNYFNFFNINGDNTKPTNESNPNAALAESLENYVFNFETALRNQSAYDYSASKTVSERAFWKWLQRTGALKLEKVTNTYGLDGSYYKELNYDASTYNPVIVGFGKVAASNYRSDESTIYNEVYVQIPSSYGMMPSWFKEYNDDNYKSLSNVDSSLQGHTEVITGGNFRNEAFKDNTGGYTVSTHENVELEFSTTNIAKLLDKSSITYDELAIDSSYIKATSYEFNAIGLYYSIYDMNSNILATNLFGIMFLDSPSSESNSSYKFSIPTLNKKKSSDTSDVKGFGNGYSFRINLRTSAIYDDTTAEIEDYSTSGSEITNDFNTVIANLNNAITIMKSNMVYNATLSDKYNALNTKVIELINTVQEQYSTLENRYTALEERVKALEEQ